MDVTHVAYEADGVQKCRPVRLPIELTPNLHRRLAQWCRETASELDVGGLARGEVIEALLAELVSDQATATAVRRRLRAQRYAGATREPPSPRFPPESGNAMIG